MKKYLNGFLLLSLLGLSNFTAANDFDNYDDLDIFSEFNVDVIHYIENTEFDITRQVTPENIIEILINIAHADRILQEDIFLKTNRLNKRSLLDNSLFFMNKDYSCGNWNLGIDLFFEQSSRMYFTNPCAIGTHKQKYDAASCIKSYLAVSSESLLCVLKDLQDEIKEILPDFSIDCIKALSLIKNATAQERSAGFFFSAAGEFKKFNFRLKLPFYYKIRNLFLTDGQRKALADEFGESDAKEGMDFARKHLISDQLGLGDLRFEFDYPVYTAARDLECRLGLFTTLPTSFAIAKGLYGTYFKPVTCRPTFSFEQMFDMLDEDSERSEGMDEIKCFALNALDGISSLLLDASLGNNKHFGLGFLMKAKLPLRSVCDRKFMNDMFLKTRLSLEYLLPADEYRWFVEKIDPSLFEKTRFMFLDDDGDWEVIEDKAAENVAFLEKIFVDKFYPFVYKTKVHPGVIFLWSTKWAYEKCRWGVHLGTDVWAQTGEKLDNICAPEDQLDLLDVCKAKRPWAYQWTLFGSIFYKINREKSDLYFGLNGEKVVSSRGIGQPFKVSLSFERNF